MVSLAEAIALEEADRAAAAELARGYLEAAGGDVQRACVALAYRMLRFARGASVGLLRQTIEKALRADCEDLARETARLAEPFAPLESEGTPTTPTDTVSRTEELP
jgi:hypothetical protein